MERTLEPENPADMRHIPPLPEIIERLDVRLRFVFETLHSAAYLANHSPDRETMQQVNQLFESLIRWLGRIAEHSRQHKKHLPADAPLQQRLSGAIDSAVASLRTLDATSFRRRAHSSSFDRSHAEPVFSCVLALGDVSWRIGELISRFDPTIYMKIYDHLLAVPPLPPQIDSAA
jgi:hypothetical protein